MATSLPRKYITHSLQLEQTQGGRTRTLGLQEQQVDRHNSQITICQNTSLYTHFGISADKHGTGETPWELPLKYEVPALARRRRSLALPVTPLAAGRPDAPKQRMGVSVGSKGCWSSSESLTQTWLLVPSALRVWHSTQVENGRGWVGNHEGIGPGSVHTKQHSPQMWPSYSSSCVGFLKTVILEA